MTNIYTLPMNNGKRAKLVQAQFSKLARYERAHREGHITLQQLDEASRAVELQLDYLGYITPSKDTADV